jgi:hypothetical protein
MADPLYLGKTFDSATQSLGEKFLLDPDDLATHGLVIGMTGSGKTGLSVGVIEELLRAKVPVIVIDPKGDMGNLALAFDRLAPDQFLPWVDADSAAREGKTREEAAAAASDAWTKGLASWGLTPADVAAYSTNHTTAVYTPGSTSGQALNVIDSMRAPAGEFEANEEELRDEIDSIVTALLGFVNITADPVSSREYILLFQLIENAWRNHQDLDLETLIGQVANPPIQKVGALPLEAFYPEKDRNALMFALNNLVASPPFEVWRTGESIDIETWIRPEDGKPRLTIIYTAHLDDDQRIFVTAIILNKLKTWMRRQPGTSHLRCLFYMDEIFGYFPPTANPPTKKPLLTLLKQARAYGVGVLLATQNPVDLDYKGLANMGFWAIGRLQTTQDQARVKEGIEAALADAGSAFNFDEMIAGVQKRVFLIHDIHRKAPALMQTRWAMSYLRGPITRDEIRLLNLDRVAPPQAAASAPSAAPAQGVQGAPAPAPAAPSGPPPLPAGFRAKYYNLRGGSFASPYVFAKVAVRYKVGGVTSDESVRLLGFPMPDGRVTELLEGTPLEGDESALGDSPPTGVSFGDVPAYLTVDGARAIERVLRDRLDDRLEAQVTYDPVAKQFARTGESPDAFAFRLSQAPAAGTKRAALQARIDKLRSDREAKKQEVSGRKLEKWISLGTSILANARIFTGRKRTVTGLGGVLSKNRMENTAEARAAALDAQIERLEAELQESSIVDPSRFEQRTVKPAKTDVSLIRYDVVWVY